MSHQLGTWDLGLGSTIFRLLFCAYVYSTRVHCRTWQTVPSKNYSILLQSPRSTHARLVQQNWQNTGAISLCIPSAYKKIIRYFRIFSILWGRFQFLFFLFLLQQQSCVVRHASSEFYFPFIFCWFILWLRLIQQRGYDSRSVSGEISLLDSFKIVKGSIYYRIYLIIVPHRA